MSLIRISESDDWIVDYDRERGMYRVSYFEDGHFKDECWFDCFEEKELGSAEQYMYEYASVFFNGAAEFMDYVRKYYENDVEIIIPPPLEYLLTKFCEQFGEVKEVQNG
jgi:hypothetical protein